MDKFDLYHDIATRTGGDIYVGVVGPVRTGKSTIIKQIMQQMVLDGIIDEDAKKRATDELPQSADGKTIMTTQPKFVPNEAVRVPISDNMTINLRLIDCVGYLVEGALGGEEDGEERMVSTPWAEENITFSKAAEIGTNKVINDHSTIALAVTCDGSFTNIPRENYVAGEEKAISQLKLSGKPFVVVLNSAKPNAPETLELKVELEAKYDVTVVVKDALNMNEDDIAEIMNSILLEFTVKIIDFEMPRWVQALTTSNSVVDELINIVKLLGESVFKMKDFENIDSHFEDANSWKVPQKIELQADKGRVVVHISPKEDVFFKVASEECNIKIEDSFELLSYLKELSASREKTNMLAQALEQVDSLGYGVVYPSLEDINLMEPEIIRQGQQYGVKLRATAPSLHIMKVDVETEVSPIVGSEEQSQEFVNNMLDGYHNDMQSIWDTNIFGRTLSSLLADGINTKLQNIPCEAEVKLKKTLSRIVNEGRGGVICILL